MSSNKLLIISHTEHYKDSEGRIVGWGPTITEINYLATIFDEVYHIAPLLTNVETPGSSLFYTNKNIYFVPLPFTGGNHIIDKFDIIWNAPKTIYKIFKYLRKVNYYHFRAPTGIGVYIIPILTLFTFKKGWYKYAGTWVGEAPILYKFQRFLLRKQPLRNKVTVNGKWKEGKKNIIPFENPCINEIDRDFGKEMVKNKSLKDNRDYCFVGAINQNKGIIGLVKVYLKLKEQELVGLGKLHVVGDGVLMDQVQQLAEGNEDIILYGFQTKDKIVKIYEKSHFVVLPSKSEGFPKVIGEAMNYGCIPIVSEISCINQYINDGKNGFLLNPSKESSLEASLLKSIELNEVEFLDTIQSNFRLANKFTFDYYLKRVKSLFH